MLLLENVVAEVGLREMRFGREGRVEVMLVFLSRAKAVTKCQSSAWRQSTTIARAGAKLTCFLNSPSTNLTNSRTFSFSALRLLTTAWRYRAEMMAEIKPVRPRLCSLACLTSARRA